MPIVKVTKGKPNQKTEVVAGRHETPYGVMTITEKGISTIEHPKDSLPFVHMSSKRKYRPSLGK